MPAAAETAEDRWPDRDRNAEGRPENARPRDRFGAPLPRGAVDELADRVEPEDVCERLEDALAAAQTLFDQERFFEAHEFFEWAWKGPVTADGDRRLFKGLAQLAVGYTHTQRGNLTGARSLLQRGIANIEGYGPRRHGVAVDRAIADARAFLDLLEHEDPHPALQFPTYPAA